MPAGFDIAQLKGTPLYALAKNANIYEGSTLSKVEMVFFQQQCREMGFDPEKYGLEIVAEDMEGYSPDQTRKNQKELTNSIDRAYIDQFGKKNNAVATAKDAEVRAYSIINTAKEAFVKNHGEMKFIPESLGLKPKFTSPEYKDNLTKYVTDLTAWGNKVAEQYRNADSMTNEQLTNLIMQNDNKNAAMNSSVTIATGEAVMQNDNFNAALLQKEINNGTAQIIQEVKLQGGATRLAIKNAKGEIINAVKTAEGNIMSEVQWQGWYSREITINQGVKTREAVREEGDKTRAQIQQEADRVIDSLDPLGKEQAIKFVRDKALSADKSVTDFVKENPEIMIPGIGIPLYTIGKLFE